MSSAAGRSTQKSSDSNSSWIFPLDDAFGMYIRMYILAFRDPDDIQLELTATYS